MVVARRVSADGLEAVYRRGHRLGNAMLPWIFSKLVDLRTIRYVLSGYRAMSRRFVKSFPLAPTGFEIEAELNAHAATIAVPIAELPTSYFERRDGSESKLSTHSDGFRILRRNIHLFRGARPALAFSMLAMPCHGWWRPYWESEWRPWSTGRPDSYPDSPSWLLVPRRYWWRC